ncbi:ABC transporter ATP-binding protein [Alicyclobacillus sp. SO9]|uniref:ABC transporter ATP-binding protein n=1 Tax=Alicyclobacillus sp. SO9 TaxID=2665646 RepID=UPI0018E727BE|nr:ABC transporter ATP-binding protein [Alicyclobacillus sp. SO9]QQE80263.1 ABC transporter ATP-binding protein [Alicyclobacillus sp. SO9]
MILLEDISKSYQMGQNSFDALKHIDLSIKAGEFVAILGPSGSGKTTLMNIIGCLDVPTTGRYVLDGQEVNALSNTSAAETRNRHIGFIFQNFYLLPRMSSVRNVELPMVYANVPRAERRQRAEQLLDRMGLADRIHHRPTELSGGQRQRVAIARALANNPPVLLADEPTGSLDSVTSGQILQTMVEVNQAGTTVVLITHDTQVASYAQRIVRMRDGTIEDDTGGQADV